MEEKRRKLWSLLALVASGLVLLALAALGASVWATPGQTEEDQTVPSAPGKVLQNTLLRPGSKEEFDICVTVPITSLLWRNVVVSDTLDSYLTVAGVSATPGAGQWKGQNVTVTVEQLDPGESVFIDIGFAVNPDAPPGQAITNVARVYADNFEEIETSLPVTITVAYPLCLPLVMKGYSAP